MTTHVHVERVDTITVLRLNRPPANAFDLPLTRHLEEQLRVLEAHNPAAIVLTGTDDFFSAGLDLKLVPHYDERDQRDMILSFGRLVARLYAFPRPTVAAVNGHAVAAGTLLTLACDYRVGSKGDYKLGLTGARVGIPYPVAAQAIFQAELDPAARRTMVLGASPLSPDEAVAKGVLDELQPPERVLARAVDVAKTRANLPAEAYGKIKRQLRSAALDRIAQATDDGADPLLGAWLTADSAAASAEALGLE